MIRTALLAVWALVGPAHATVPDTATVASVYDGDTLTLDTGDKVRLALVNAPELKPPEAYGVEAREATAALVLNKRVKLRHGPVERDGYGRLLAGIVTVDGEVDLSAHLLELGLAHLYVIPPSTVDLAPYIAAQEKAKAARRGIWSDPRFAGELHITSFHANAKGDDRENPHGEYLRVCNISGRPLDLAGFKLANIAGRSWTLPNVVVPAGHTVKLISGMGQDQTDPQAQLEIYLDTDGPIWNNEKDRATLYDRFGKVVDARDHEVQGKAAP